MKETSQNTRELNLILLKNLQTRGAIAHPFPCMSRLCGAIYRAVLSAGGRDGTVKRAGNTGTRVLCFQGLGMPSITLVHTSTALSPPRVILLGAQVQEI